MVCSKSPGWPGPVQCKWSAVQLLIITEVQFTMPLVLQPLVHGKIFALDAYSTIPWNHMIIR